MYIHDSDAELNCMCFAYAFKHIILCFRLLSMVVSTYVLFLCKKFIMHLCFFTVYILHCSAQLSMSNVEKCYRNKVIIVVIIIIIYIFLF